MASEMKSCLSEATPINIRQITESTKSIHQTVSNIILYISNDKTR